MDRLTASETTALDCLIQTIEDDQCRPMQAAQIAELIGSDSCTVAAKPGSIDPGFAATLLRTANDPRRGSGVGGIAVSGGQRDRPRASQRARAGCLVLDHRRRPGCVRCRAVLALLAPCRTGGGPRERRARPLARGGVHRRAVAGLGRLALEQGKTRLFQAQELARLSRIDLESALFGEFAVDSPTLGAVLAERWC